MAISNKPGINNWSNGRYRNTYTITQDIKHNQPIKIKEQPQSQIEETSKIIEEVKIEEPKSIKPKKQWDNQNQNLTPLSGSETNI
jgi:hypothetical protein